MLQKNLAFTVASGGQNQDWKSKMFTNSNISKMKRTTINNLIVNTVNEG